MEQKWSGRCHRKDSLHTSECTWLHQVTTLPIHTRCICVWDGTKSVQLYQFIIQLNTKIKIMYCTVYCKALIINGTHLFPFSTSGLQYSTVPANWAKVRPGRVKAADPKSMSLTWKLASRITFSSFTSRWTILSEWRYRKADTIWKRSGNNAKLLFSLTVQRKINTII